MSASPVGLIEFGGGTAGRVESPGDLFEIANEFLAAWIDVEVDLVESVFETAVDAVDAVAHGGVGAGGANGWPICAAATDEEIANESPIGIGGGGTALIAAGVAIDFDIDGAIVDEFLNALMKGIAGGVGIGVRLDDDFVENVDGIAAPLHEKHAHGIDVEIERPDERRGGDEAGRFEVNGAVEGVVDAMAASASESGFKFLMVSVGIEMRGGRLDFFGTNVSALSGSELESGPIGRVFGVFVEVVEVIAALRSADEESAALAIGESGTDDLGPSLRAHGSEFIEDDEIETVAAQRIGAVGPPHRDGGAADKLDGEFGFRGTETEIAREIFEAIPDDAFRLRIIGADVPDELAPFLGRVKHFGERQPSFAEAAACDENAEACRIIEHLHLLLTEADRGGFKNHHWELRR